MGRIPNALREVIVRNIRNCRLQRFPGRSGGKQCAEFFGMTVERMRSDHRPQPGIHQAPPNIGDKPPGVREPPPPSWNSAPPGSAASSFWLAHHIIMSMETRGLRLDKESLEYLARCIKQS